MAQFFGKWELISTDDNFDKYMEATGVTEEKRKLAGAVLCGKVYHDISRNGSTWNIKIITAAGERLFEYPEGQSVKIMTLDDREVSVVYTLEGDKLIESQTGNGFTSQNVRTVSGDKLTMTFTSGDVTSVRVYNKV